MNETKVKLGNRIAELRKSKKIKQEDFRQMIDAPTVQMISNWENGHSFPSLNYLIIIAKVLDTTLDYLVLGKETQKKDTAIKTYGDAATYIIELQKSKLFKISGRNVWGASNQLIRITTLETENQTIHEFWTELDSLNNASKTLRPELYNQAISDLVSKYETPIKEK